MTPLLVRDLGSHHLAASHHSALNGSRAGLGESRSRSFAQRQLAEIRLPSANAAANQASGFFSRLETETVPWTIGTITQQILSKLAITALDVITAKQFSSHKVTISEFTPGWSSEIKAVSRRLVHFLH